MNKERLCNMRVGNGSTALLSHHQAVATMKLKLQHKQNSPSKSDNKDILVILEMVKNRYCSPCTVQPSSLCGIPELIVNRDTVTKRLNSAVNQIHCWVDIFFPELLHVFKIITSTRASPPLRLFPLQKDKLLPIQSNKTCC
jgi:transposase